jgi:hypothetical protein
MIFEKWDIWRLGNSCISSLCVTIGKGGLCIVLIRTI